MLNYFPLIKFGRNRNFLIDLLFILVAALALPIFLIYSYSLDDLQAFSANQQRTYFELAFGSHGWSGTVFYRPLIDLQTKFIWDVFSASYFAFKGYQFALFLVFLIGLRYLVRHLEMSVFGVCVLLSMTLASRAIHDAFLWWVNMGQAVVLICFVGMLIFLTKRLAGESNSFGLPNVLKAGIYSGISFLAIFSKEIGLAVLIGFVYLAYLEKNRVAIYMLFTVFAVFVLARVQVVGVIAGVDPFMASSGFGFSFLSSGQLQEAFGGNKYLYYAYNVTSQFFYVLLRQPVNGQFNVYSGGLRGLVIVGYAAASCFIFINILLYGVRQRTTLILFLLASVAVNSVLSFPYARERIMVVADISCAMIFALIANNSFGVLKIKTSTFSEMFSHIKIPLTFITILSVARGTWRYGTDVESSISVMKGFLTGDYSIILERSGDLPSGISRNVIDGLSQHYEFILNILERMAILRILT